MNRFLGAILNGLGDRHSDFGLRLDVEESLGEGLWSSPSEVCSSLGIFESILATILTGSLDFRLFRLFGLLSFIRLIAVAIFCNKKKNSLVFGANIQTFFFNVYVIETQN